ncbi:hypothetical protein EMCG_06011 [[Emmonsia] crescens]|uniref:Uncharacterized protein n=1 Tax=[Emmonsia] crescens TaxID=73230 RepID=A0A0G2IDI1_9EURO|nr:hypothetical protein EMCG_06011 [Emmonsia crescens UAMH 3008]
MNLRGRDAIKPPKRYDEEMFMKPTPPPPAHNEPRGYDPNVWRPTFPSPLVDFNPDLPPAAFPTIDCHQPPKPPAQEVLWSSSNTIGPMQGHDGANVVSGESILDGHHMAKSNHEQGMGGDGDGDVSMLDAGYDFSDNTPDKLDYQACWDYVNYLNELENSAEGVTRSMNLSDDENDVGIGAYEAAGMSVGPLRGGKWSDISPILQTEIFENLRSVYDYRQAVEALRLSPSEQVKMIEHSSARKEQVQRENVKLNEMRMKQLRALLRMDNSYLRTQKVPGQLVFRNISKKCLRDTTARSGPDYSMSQASDILIARKYLRSLGLDPIFAGEWSNNLVTITTTGMLGGEEDFEWTGELPVSEEANISEHGDTEYESSVGSETTHDDSSQSDCSPTPKRPRTLVPNLNAAQQILCHRRESSVSRTSMTRSLPFRGPSTRTGSSQSLQSSRRFRDDRPQPSPLGRESVVRLRVGPQGAARIQQDIFGMAVDIMRAPSQPQTSVASNNTNSANQVPPLGFRNMPSLDGIKIPSQHGFRQQRSSKKGGCETLKRSLGGTWYYSKSREETDAASRASRVLRNRLASAKAEAEAARRSDSACHGSITTSPLVNLTLPSPGNTYGIHNNGLCECQSEELKRVEPLAGWTAGGSGDPQTPPILGANIVPHYTSLSNHIRAEGNGPQYSPITPPSIEAPRWPEENQTDPGELEGYAIHPRPDDAEMQGDATGASCSRSTAERLSSKHGPLHAAENSVSPVPELETTDVNGEGTVMGTGIAQDKFSPASTETAAPATPDMTTVLFCPKEQLPDSSNAEPAVPLSLETTEKPRKKTYRKCGNGWAKKKKPFSKPVESFTETVQGPTKKATKSSVPGVETTNSGRRRSERINKQAGLNNH